MQLLDLLIIAVYLAGLVYVGCWVLRKGSLEEFLVNDRKTKLFLLVFTIISSNVGMGTFLGLSSAAFETGISYGLTGFLAVFMEEVYSNRFFLEYPIRASNCFWIIPIYSQHLIYSGICSKHSVICHDFFIDL